MTEVVIAKTTPDIPTPEYQTEGAAGFDLAAYGDYCIEPGDYAMVSTGLVITTPPGHMLMLAPRSSLYKRKGLVMTNSVGIVDEDYSGPDDVILLSLKNVSNVPVYIDEGERVAQGIFVPVSKVQFVEKELSGASRGGWGSTGD